MGGDQADGIEQSDVDRVSAKRCGDRTRAWKELEFNVEAGLLENAEIDAEKRFGAHLDGRDADARCYG
jgi:hypothetical protein